VGLLPGLGTNPNGRRLTLPAVPEAAASRGDRFTLVQLSDPHIGAEWAPGDPVAGLSAAVASVAELHPGADAVLVSGDLAEHAAHAEYELLRELLAPLAAPLLVLPGNHDDRGALRSHFDLPGPGSEPIRYAQDLGALRLVALDTTIPGEPSGRLDADQLEWLDTELGAAPTAPTVVAMHHPPLPSGLPAFDAIGIPAEHREAFARVVARHEQVKRIVAGHVHRVIIGEVGGRSALVAPSTYVQARLDFVTESIQLDDEPAGFAVHVLSDGAVLSHIQPIEYRR
jgi:3',5'-cyclic-AMP phosphodiesterase